MFKHFRYISFISKFCHRIHLVLSEVYHTVFDFGENKREIYLRRSGVSSTKWFLCVWFFEVYTQQLVQARCLI